MSMQMGGVRIQVTPTLEKLLIAHWARTHELEEFAATNPMTYADLEGHFAQCENCGLKT